MKFESYEAEKGSYRWRLLKADGGIFEMKPGKIMGLKGSSRQKKVSERVVNEALKRLADKGGKAVRPPAPRRSSKQEAGA